MNSKIKRLGTTTLCILRSLFLRLDGHAGRTYATKALNGCRMTVYLGGKEQGAPKQGELAACIGQ